MYLCIGVVIKILSLCKKSPNIKDPDIVYKMFLNICNYVNDDTKIDEDTYWEPTKVSKYKKCTMDINPNIREHVQNTNVDIVKMEFESAVEELLLSVIDLNKLVEIVSAIVSVIENDSEIDANTIVGYDEYYTRKNILRMKKFYAKEFISNVLFYVCYTGDNRKGQDTISAIDKDFLVETAKWKNIDVITDASDNDIKYIDNVQIDSYNQDKKDLLPRNLTSTMVVGATEESVIFREEELGKIINSLEYGNKSIILCGMGGCGKTSVARLAYNNLKEKYDCYGWINYSVNLKQSMLTALNFEDYSDDSVIENDFQKRWEFLRKKILESKQKLLLVIDNVDYIDSVQDPMTDKDLIGITSWDNVTLILTSRLASIPGYNNILPIDNLGNDENCEKCIELFYYYNSKAKKFCRDNRGVVKKLCGIAYYNTMVIELLAKGSKSLFYSDNLEEFYDLLIDKGLNELTDLSVSTLHDFTVINTRKDGILQERYYDIGKETLVSQLAKLFNIKNRSEEERLILWDFHCLPEGEKITRYELTNWVGVDIQSVEALVDEGWLNYLDGNFGMHPLVWQSVALSGEDWNYYIKIYQNLMQRTHNSYSIVDAIRSKKIFSESDTFDISIRKIYFAYYLSYQGRLLDAEDWLYIADFARKRGAVKIGKFFYKLAYDNLSKNNNYSGITEIDMRNLWKSSYYYGYMLSYSKIGHSEAEKYIRASIDMAEYLLCRLGIDDKNALLLATSLDHLGYIRSVEITNDIREITITDIILTEAVQIRRILCEGNQNQIRLLHDYAWSLDNIGAFYTNIDENQIEFVKNDNTNDVIYLTYDEITERQKLAENYLRESLNIRKALANARHDQDSTEVAWTLFNLSTLLIKKYKLEDAEIFLKEAMDIYNRLDSRFPGQHMSSQARTMFLYARLLCLKTGDSSIDANKYFREALKAYETLSEINPGMYDNEMQDIRQEINSQNKKL